MKQTSSAWNGLKNCRKAQLRCHEEEVSVYDGIHGIGKEKRMEFTDIKLLDENVDLSKILSLYFMARWHGVQT